MEVEIQPTSKELLAIIALLWMENDALRGHFASLANIAITKRTFTNEELARAAPMLPKARLTHGGSIVLNMES